MSAPDTPYLAETLDRGVWDVEITRNLTVREAKIDECLEAGFRGRTKHLQVLSQLIGHVPTRRKTALAGQRISGHQFLDLIPILPDHLMVPLPRVALSYRIMDRPLFRFDQNQCARFSRLCEQDFADDSDPGKTTVSERARLLVVMPLGPRSIRFCEGWDIHHARDGSAPRLGDASARRMGQPTCERMSPPRSSLRVISAQSGVRVQTAIFTLEDANAALNDLREGRWKGAAVLVP